MCQTLCHDHFPWVPSTLPAKAWRQIATLPLERWNTESSEVKALSDHRTVSLEQAVFKTRCDSKINHEQVKHENTKQASFSKHSLREEKKKKKITLFCTPPYTSKSQEQVFFHWREHRMPVMLPTVYTHKVGAPCICERKIKMRISTAERVP